MRDLRKIRAVAGVFLVIPFLFALTLTAPAQGISAGKSAAAPVVGKKLASKLTGREMPYNVILPSGYDAAAAREKRYPVIYLLHGLTGHFDDWANKTGLGEYSREFGFIIVMPEGNDGWYTDSATVPNDKYESYIVRELIPEIDRLYRTEAVRDRRVIAGLSMGGYGAIKFGLKYPGMFALVGSFSGALGVTELTDKNSAQWVSRSVMSVYGEAASETRASNDIFRIVSQLTPEQTARLPFIYFDCGTEDFLSANNREFLRLLIEKKVPHEYRELPGIHDWKYWDSQIREFLRVSARRLPPARPDQSFTSPAAS